MSYLENRNSNVMALHSLYSELFPEALEKFFDFPELLRLNGIEQSSGIEYTGFKMYKYKYSVLDHSLGVALILNTFSNDKKQVVSALLHDINVPAFAKSSFLIEESNFEKGDNALSQYDFIVGSNNLFDYFFRNNIDINEVINEKKFHLAYGEVPHLSAHNLEYFLRTAFLSGMCSIDNLKQIYDDLFMTQNENGQDEFCFKTPQIAKKFFRISMECAKKFRSYEAKYAIKFVSDTLAAMIRREIITRKDLYKYSDRVIMDMGLSCSDKRISDRWKYLPEINKVYSKFNPIEGKKCFKIESELVYADPLVRIKNSGFNLRLSEIDKEVEYEIEEFLNSDTDLYMYGEYED